jgi:lipopolysaccharide transport system permease protein
MPTLIVLGGLLVRLVMARLTRTSVSAAAVESIIVKSVPWAFFVGSVGFATNTLVANSNLVTKIYFPRAVLPLAAVLAHAVDAIVATVAALVMIAFLGFPAISFTLLWIPILVILICLLTAATALLCSCGNLFFRDVKYLVQVVLMFGIFFTPVLFDAGMVGGEAAALLMLNPLAPLLEGLRLAFFESHNLALPLLDGGRSGLELWKPWFLVYSATFSIGAFVCSLAMFHRMQFLFAEYV